MLRTHICPKTAKPESMLRTHICPKTAKTESMLRTHICPKTAKTELGGSVVWALDSWLKGQGFEYRQARRGRIFVSRVHCLCWLLFRYPFHPRVTAVARKRTRSFCQKCRWQVTAKHARTLRDVVHGCMVYTKRAETAAASPPPPCNIQTAL